MLDKYSSENKKSFSMKKLFSLVDKRSGCLIIFAVILRITKTILQIIQFMIIAKLLQNYFLSGFVNFTAIGDATKCFIIIIIVQYLFTVFYQKCLFLASSNIRNHLRDRVYSKLLDLELGYLDSTPTTSIIASSVNGIETLEIFFGGFLPQLFYTIIVPIILCIFLWQYNWIVVLVLIFGIPLIGMTVMKTTGKAKIVMSDYWDDFEDMGAYFLDSLQGLYTLKMLGKDEERSKLLDKKWWHFRDITMDLLRVQLQVLIHLDSVSYGMAAIAMVIAALSFIGGASISAILIIIFLAVEFFLPLRQLSSLFHSGLNGVIATKTIFELFEEKPKIKQLSKEELTKTNIDFTKQLEPNIIFHKVDFSYDKEREILTNLNFEIKPGNVVALVGESGSGKTTIGNMIVRFYDPDKGKITFGGYDLKNLPLDYLRRQISFVSSHTYIFAGTIADNLKIAKPDATEEEMIKACKIAGLGEFIETSPEGINIEVGEWGSKLSGGEKQRIGIARAVLYNAQLYIFDEATSNVDIYSENKIWASIYNLAKEKTTLIISHRLATVKNADKIIVLKDGKIIEQGTHPELMEKVGYYNELVEEQAILEEYSLKGGEI